MRRGSSDSSSRSGQEAGLVVELGCGSGLLTRYLIEAGHRVIATDGSPAMLDLARTYVPEAEAIERLVLPDDPVPAADAVVSIGHVLSYLGDEGSVERALIRAAAAVRPGGVLAIDICDLEWGTARIGERPAGRVDDDWALVTRFSLPTPARYVRQMAIFTRNVDGSWRRDDERHETILVDTSSWPALLRSEGICARVTRSFGAETLPVGLRAVVGHRP